MPKVVRKSRSTTRIVRITKIESQLRKALRQNDSVLYRQLARETKKSAIRHAVRAPEQLGLKVHLYSKREDGRTRMGRNPLTGQPVRIQYRLGGKRRWRNIDQGMLAAFRKALGGTASESDGKDLFPSLWGRIGDTICDDWDFCERVKIGDDAFMILAGLVLHILKTKMDIDSDIVVPLCVIAWHKGPEFICNCPKEDKSKKKRNEEDD